MCNSPKPNICKTSTFPGEWICKKKSISIGCTGSSMLCKSLNRATCEKTNGCHYSHNKIEKEIPVCKNKNGKTINSNLCNQKDKPTCSNSTNHIGFCRAKPDFTNGTCVGKPTGLNGNHGELYWNCDYERYQKETSSISETSYQSRCLHNRFQCEWHELGGKCDNYTNENDCKILSSCEWVKANGRCLGKYYDTSSSSVMIPYKNCSDITDRKKCENTKSSLSSGCTWIPASLMQRDHVFDNIADMKYHIGF